jgi:hypothetical protein
MVRGVRQIADSGRPWQAALSAACLIALLAWGSCGVFDRLHPRDRIISNSRIWRCALVGGSWPVEAASLVGLRSGLRVESIGAVETDGVWISAMLIEEGSRRTVVGVVLGDSAGPRLGGLDETGRELTARDSSLRANHYDAELEAARECLERRLPE